VYQPARADLVLRNGKIVTMDETNPIVEALAVRGNRIVALGPNERIDPLVGPATRCLDLEGTLAIPGIIDSHCHPDSAVLARNRYSLAPPEVNSMEQLLALVRRETANLPKDQWFLGAGFNNIRLGGYPSREQLDRVSNGRPVFLHRMDGHVGIANSRAFEIMGIPEDVKDPPHGSFDRDPSSGHLTGVVRERAFYLFRQTFFSEMKPEDYVAGLPHVFRDYLSAGITSVHSSVVRPPVLQAYQILRREDRLNMRVGVLASGEDPHMSEALVRAGFRAGFGDEWLQLKGVEWTADASISGRTAAFYEPYVGEPDRGEPTPNRGMVLYDRKDLEARVSAVHQAGLQVCLEGLGDRGIDFALDIMEAALRSYPVDHHRMRIEHCCYVPPPQRARMKALGVIDSSGTGFLHDLGDIYRLNRGEKAMRFMFPHRSLIDEGIPAAGHSDHPVCTYNPFVAMWSMASRQSLTGDDMGQEERVTIEEALYAYTVLGAYAGKEEHMKGRLRPGMLADMAILDRDIFRVDLDAVRQTRVLATILDGKVRHGEKHFPR